MTNCAAEKPMLPIQNVLLERTAGVEFLLSSVARDLQQPLRALDGCSQALQRRHVERLNEEGKRMLQTLSTELSRTGQLLDGLLTYSRVGIQALEKEQLNMEALAASVCRTVTSVTGRKVDFRVGRLPEAYGDRGLLRHVFFNLLTNAVKFTGKTATPVIEVGADKGPLLCRYWVKDNGVGFDSAQAHRLFGVFQRLHNASCYEGTGLGLAIAERIVRRHGGRVHARGVQGEGATFEFTIPAGTPEGI